MIAGMPPATPDDDTGVTPLSVVTRRQQRIETAPALRGDDREARLVEVAEELLRRGEFEATSISKIAAASGLSRPGFYFYFSSKDELLGHLAMRHLRALLDDADRWLTDLDRPPADTILDLVQRSAQNWRDHPEVMRAGVELGKRVPGLWENWQAVTAHAAAAMSTFVVHFTSDPSLRDPEAATRAAQALGWMVERSLYTHYSSSGASAEEEAALIGTLHGVMLRALALPGASA